MSQNQCQPKEKIFCTAIETISDPNGQYGRGTRLFIATTESKGEFNKRLCYQFGPKTSDYCFVPFCPACGVRLK